MPPHGQCDQAHALEHLHIVTVPAGILFRRHRRGQGQRVVELEAGVEQLVDADVDTHFDTEFDGDVEVEVELEAEDLADEPQVEPARDEQPQTSEQLEVTLDQVTSAIDDLNRNARNDY